MLEKQIIVDGQNNAFLEAEHRVDSKINIILALVKIRKRDLKSAPTH